MLAASIIIGVLGKAMSLAAQAITSVGFITKVVGCMGSCLKCMSFGFVKSDIVVQVDAHVGKKMTEQHSKIQKKLG